MRIPLPLLLFVLAVNTVGCYSLNGISITEETDTYYVEQFEVNALEAPAELGQQFSEQLKQRINSDTRLAFDDVNADVVFEGAVVAFSVEPESANADNRADLSRLTVRVSVDYVDTVTEANSYTQTFTEFEVFDATANLFDIQDDLLAQIFERIVEDSFNKAFSNW